jgi:predicted nuclease of predicted toxin-antitoxin system
MIIWVDAQLPSTLAAWIVETFGITALSLKELGITVPKRENRTLRDFQVPETTILR